jgi:hypothetical protein
MNEVFGPDYAASVASDQVLTPLGRTIKTAIAEGEDVGVIWRAVVAQYEDRIPARLK